MPHMSTKVCYPRNSDTNFSCCAPCLCDYPLGFDFAWSSELSDLDCPCGWPDDGVGLTELRDGDDYLQYFFGLTGGPKCWAYWRHDHRCCPTYADPDRWEHIAQQFLAKIIPISNDTVRIELIFIMQRMIGKVSGSAPPPYNCCTNPDVFGDWMLFPSICSTQNRSNGCVLTDIKWRGYGDLYVYEGPCPTEDLVIPARGEPTSTGGCSGSETLPLCALPESVTWKVN